MIYFLKKLVIFWPVHRNIDFVYKFACSSNESTYFVDVSRVGCFWLPWIASHKEGFNGRRMDVPTSVCLCIRRKTFHRHNWKDFLRREILFSKNGIITLYGVLKLWV